MSRTALSGVLLAAAVTSGANVAASQPASPLDEGAASGLRGRITNSTTDEPIAGATIEARSPIRRSAVADAGGRYRLALDPGVYALRVHSPLHSGRRVENVIIQPGRFSRLDVPLAPASDAIEEVVVYATPERRTEAGALEIRRHASSVSDALSAEEISRAPDSSASSAVKRIVSATVVDGRYVYIRGLGGRYVTTLLNGVTLPSPEPDRQAVPLDLFPTSLLSNLTIAKSYGVETPGTFAGGTLMINTSSYPDDLTVKAKVSSSASTASTFEDRSSYAGGSLDFLGFDDGTRALPGAVPGEGPARVGGDLDAGAMEDIGEAFTNNWVVTDETAPPSLGLGLTAGDTVTAGGRRLGYLTTISFSRGTRARRSEIAKVRTAGGETVYRQNQTAFDGSESARLGGLASVGFELREGHDLSIVNLYSHTGESSAQRVTGVDETEGMAVEKTRLRFIERSLNFTQLESRHRFPRLAGARLRTQANLGLTSRDEPDTRDLTYTVLGDGRHRFKGETGSGERFFSDLGERSMGAGLDLSARPISRLEISGGASLQRSDREFGARRFRNVFVGTDPMVLFEPPSTIFSAENIGPSFRLEERTLSTDAYDASLDVFAGYLSGQLEISERLRGTAGVRLERSRQALEAGSRFAGQAADPEDSVARTDLDPLPMAALTYALRPDLNLRAAYSYTLARPMFRELAPFLYFDYTRQRSVSGNPELVQTRIHNADVRAEWFASDLDVFAISGFYKRFTDPIEQVIVSAGGDVSFANAPLATTVGAELEARTSLARLHPSLSPLRLWTNLTLIRSRVELAPDQLGPQTSAERPLQGQSPVVVNLGLGYEHAPSAFEATALYNLFGRRVDEVGFDSLPDVYERPMHRVDVTASKGMAHGMTLKLGATNLLDEDIVLEQGDLTVLRYKPGVGFSAALEWSY
jgi:hypothetical protein